MRQNSSHPPLPDLPVGACLPVLRDALAGGHAILTAEPGSGKTTLVPLLLRNEPWLDGRRIVMLEPRRPAARMAARRMAALLHDEIGGEVGYRVRFERRTSERTRIEVVTEGLLLRQLQADPELSGIGLVIFDEFHERNLHADLSLALCLDVCAGLRDDLRLLVMSASLDVAPLARLMPARVIEASGKCHPVDVIHSDADPDPAQLLAVCEAAIARALSLCDGDVLVFLPGRAEIERLQDSALTRWGRELDVLPLYGDLPAAAQDAVLSGRGTRRRIIVATDIAETSLTIEGVEVVVDAGLARRPCFDPNTGLTRLETRWISQASALQRTGRAGRLGPGYCLRLWTRSRHERLLAFSPAEISEADLAPLVLELANWGVTDPAALRWLDIPPEANWQQAVVLLRSLGALDASARITASGAAMASLPAHPRLAHMLVVAPSERLRQLAAAIAALLSERDPAIRDRVTGPGCDIEFRLDALEDLRNGRPVPAGVDRRALQRIERAASQLLRMGGGDAGCAEADTAAALLAMAYPDRVAQCSSPDGRRYLMRNGRAALLDERDVLRGRPFLVVASLDAGHRDGRIWLAAELPEEKLDALFADAIVRRREVRWDGKRKDIVARRVRRLDALVLDEEAVSLEPGDDVTALVFDRIRADGLAAWLCGADELRARVQLMKNLLPDDDWPDFSEGGLLRDIETWLAPWLRPGQGMRQLKGLDLQALLEGMLGWERRQQLDAWLPTHFETPAGTRRRIDYSAPGDPVLAVPLQELLGMQAGPQLAGGRVTPLLHLLSPAGRPLQVTRDLAGFWRGAYAEVKKEMRGRYPKHVWPDDPATASATRFTKRRMQ